MSVNEDIDDLEDGEITENNSFDSPFAHNFNANETKLSKNSNEISPIFQTLLSQKRDPLFGSSDTDLRVSRHQNVFNDCDERFLSNEISFGADTTFDSKPRFMSENIRNGPTFSPQISPSNYRPFVENRFHSFDARPRLPLHRFDFRAPENQIPVRLRPQTRALLPTPAFPPRYGPPIHTESQSYRPPISVPDLLADPTKEQSIDLNQTIPFTIRNEQKTVNPEALVIPSLSRNNTVIPFICEPIVPQIPSETEIQAKDNNVSKTQDLNPNRTSGEKTIVLGSNEDIEEVQMQISDADEPYDPEQDITLMCAPISPPFPSPRKNEVKRGSVGKIRFVSSELLESKDQNLNKSYPKRSENSDRNERLNRLLKSHNSCNEKRRLTGKTSKKESLRMTPKVMPKFVDTMKPINTSSTKRVVHNKSCKKSHKSRRKMKRITKRRVFTENNCENKTDANDSTYDDLLEEYQRIKRQLQELESEEKNESNAEKDIDRQEKERIENLFKSEDISEVSNESKVDLVISEDDDENELRRLALESKKRREMKIAEEKEADEEELLLRQQLLKSLKFKLKPSLQSNEENISNDTPEENALKPFEENSEIDSIVENIDKNDSPVPNTKSLGSETSSKSEALEPIPPKPVPKLIIHFGDDSTDEEFEAQTISSTLNGPLGLDSFIKQVRLRSETKTHSSPPIPVMSVTKQKELEKLKAEIVRREMIQINDKKLKQNEVQWKSAKERLTEKISKQNLLKTRLILKRTALRKAQIQARKMQEAFRAATRLVSSTASEFHSFNNELKNIDTDVKQELLNIEKYEKECIRMGLKLYGNTYKLPIPVTIKRSTSVSTSVSPNRKRLKSENLSKEEMADEKKRLVKQLENCHKLLSLKKANLLRPSSPKVFTKSVQNSESIDKSIDSQQTLKTLAKDLLSVSPSDSIISLNCFLEKMFFNKNSKPLNISICIPENISNSTLIYKSNRLDESYDSALLHLHSYRFIENQSIPISSDHWTNNLNPLQELCKFDLLGTCKDDKCLGQHFDKFLLNPYNKIVDLLLYDPEIGGITSNIPERMDLELFDAIKQKLIQSAQKLIDSDPKIPLETHCRNIAEQIRKRANESVVCLLNRRIPKIFDTLRIEVPFDDLKYRFNIKDKSLIINQTMISELKLSADPDIYFKNRFYAPEGVPISAELETSLATDPHNIQLWIKLAYYHISRCSDNNFADSVDRALNVLSRALDHNRTEPELYEHYLFVYSNRVLRKDEDPKFNLFNICRKVVEHCPHYRVRKCVLSLFVDFKDKMTASTEVINDLLNKSVPLSDYFETLSHQILEVFCYKIRLNLEQNNIKQSILEFNKALNKDFVDNSSESGIVFLSDALTFTDRVFGWLCFTYLLIHSNLPNHCFELSNQGFPRLIDKKPFIFDWISLKNKINLIEMKEHLTKAIEYCDIRSDPSTLNSNHLAIHLNYAELCVVSENGQKYYQYLMDLTQNNSKIWSAIVDHTFKSDQNNSNLIETLKNSSIYSKDDIRIHLNVAKLHYKSHQFLEARNELVLIASKFYTSLISDNYLIKAYETLLLEDEENNHNFELINSRKSKESDSPIIWLSYILLLEIDCQSVKEIDSAFLTALALCSVDKTDTKDLQLLWSNYLEFCVQNMTNEKQLMDLLESVRHCCLTITDPTFQSQVIRFFCRLITNNEKSKALIQFAKLIPQNVDIILTAINFGLRINKKESVWIFINSIVFDRKVRLKSLQFWKIAIGLAIDRSDHLSVHKFFQIAISLMPYNCILWQNFKTYETSVKHLEHLKQAKDVCENQLKISHFS